MTKAMDEALNALSLQPFHKGQEVVHIEEPNTILRVLEVMPDMFSPAWFVKVVVSWEPTRPFTIISDRLRAVSRSRETMRDKLRLITIDGIAI